MRIITLILSSFLLASCGPKDPPEGKKPTKLQKPGLASASDPYHIPVGADIKIDQFFVINLDKSQDRLIRMRNDFARNGLEFERFPAVYGKSLTEEERKHVYHYDSRYLKRGLADGEIGNYLSHFGALSKIV